MLELQYQDLQDLVDFFFQLTRYLIYEICQVDKISGSEILYIDLYATFYVCVCVCVFTYSPLNVSLKVTFSLLGSRFRESV